MEELTEKEQQKLDGILWAGTTELVELAVKRDRIKKEKEND